MNIQQVSIIHSWLTKGVLIVCAALFIIGIAPYYLLYSVPPVASDVVVVLVGPKREQRTNQGINVVVKGLAQNLFIPGVGKLVQVNDAGVLEVMHLSASPPGNMDAKLHKKMGDSKLEDTHREILMAKDMMARIDWHSVIFVSSPYHMRRIKLIADREFAGDRYNTSFVAAGEPIGKPYLWWLSKDSWWWVTHEYVKIVWFLLYAPFVR